MPDHGSDPVAPRRDDLHLLGSYPQVRARVEREARLGDRITLRDAATGRSATVDDPIAATPASVGTTVLWRIVRLGSNDYPPGYAVEVNPDRHDKLQKLLAADPTANNLLAGYHKTS